MEPMQIDCLPRQELTPEHLAAWSGLQCADPALDSPFFRPEFSQLVAEVRPDVEVAVVESRGCYVGFWPFQRTAGNVACSAGRTLCDFEGLVAERDLVWSPEEVLRQCRLATWSFDHAVASQAPLHNFHWHCSRSPVIDLTSGFDEYYRRKRLAGSSTLRETLRKARKLERDVGPLRFVPHHSDERLLHTVINWKRAQYQRIRSVDHLSAPWTRELLARVARYRSPDFSGMLSALYAGDHLVGAHLGLRSRHVLHSWFPTFNREFERYSPGLVFWLTLAQQAAELGIQRIDLGRGDERYKQSLKTGDIVLAEGTIEVRNATRALRRSWWLAKHVVRRSPLATPLRYIIRSARAAKRLRNSETLVEPDVSRPNARSESHHEEPVLKCD